MELPGSHAQVLDDAVRVLMTRGGLPPRVALAALFEVAQKFGVEVDDLAVLVSSSERRRRAGRPSASVLRIAGTAQRGPRSLDEEPVAAPVRVPGEHVQLSARQSEMVGLIVAGLTNEEIAARCHLSANSVKKYVRTAYRKMGVRTRVQAVLWGLDHGFSASSAEWGSDGPADGPTTAAWG